MSAFYPLAGNNWGEEEKRAIHALIAANRVTMGPEVQAFEHEFAGMLGVRYAAMTSSGSMANLIAVASLFYKKEDPLRRGDEVIVPAVAWATTYAPLQQLGLKLIVVDIDLETLNIDETRLARALTPRTRMVVVVNILGNPCRLDVISRFCKDRGLYLFEDNCESLGAELDGKKCGTFGEIATHSTFFSHQINTMEGGMIATASRELYDLCICLRAHGWTRNLGADTEIYARRAEDFFEAYRFILPGFNGRPLELSGAVGRVQLARLSEFLERRRKNAEVFKRLFGKDERLLIQREVGTGSWFSFTMILRRADVAERAKVMDAMRENGIEFRIITGGSFVRHDARAHYDYSCPVETVNANLAHDFGFFVGNHPVDLTPQLVRLREILDKTLA